MKYKIGQKVRIKKASESHCTKWGTPGFIGKECVIESYTDEVDYPYRIKPNNTTGSFHYREEELEPVIKVGQQLVFPFMEEK